jgi:hypothetical protein
VTANGDAFVVGPGFAIPAKIATTNTTNSVGQVVALSNAVFTVSSSLGTNKYSGKTLQVLGSAFTITTNTATNITVSGTPTLAFRLHDDDDDTILPHVPQIGTEVASLYATAYIKPIVDGGGNLTNNSTNVGFVANAGIDIIPIVMQSSSALQSTTNRATNFWVAYVLMGYQFAVTPEQAGPPGPNNSPRADSDPDAETPIPGINVKPYGTIIYWECFREYRIFSSEERTISHEMAHQFGVVDTYISGTTPSDDIMGSGTYSVGSHFYPAALDALRCRSNSPGQ